MPRVLLIGLAPETVDFSDPDLPPGMNAEKIAAGIEAALADMRGRGWEAEFCSLRPDDSAEGTIAAALAHKWDCVVIGGGLRLPAKGLLLFERVINAVTRAAPGTPIAFNTSPETTADAAARWLGPGTHQPSGTPQWSSGLT
ncbi:hypothetical protein [Enterovirga sp. CN4-39]|uniref:hypothetical protein n=1 Tax=Enterovirga sp. CN4-39 TaxID=3400910 RepID=UPI003C0E2ECC